MLEKEKLEKIKTAIKNFSAGDFSKNAIDLFTELGYNTERSNPLLEKSYAYFIENYPPPPPPCTQFNAEKARVSEWNYVDILFQLSDSEISNQNDLWDNKKVDNTIINSYLFIAVGLSKNEYTRSRLAQICREINKIFPMPVLVMFKYGGYITLSVIDRRINKQHGEKDVLEKVTLIKNILIANPHRAHIEIIASLAMKELQDRSPITNFVELHKAWRSVLNIDALNKEFYRRLVDWYEMCLQNIHINLTKANAILGKDIENELKPQAVIRVIIRMLFMWFMKEKRLIKPDFFTKTFAEEFLKNKNTYYNAVLQNLFFAVLNKKIDERRFRKCDSQNLYDPNKNDYGVSDVFRFYELFKEGKADEFLELTKTIPFVNGGLFTCHDYKFSGKDIEKNSNVKNNYIIDGFSDNIKDRAVIDDNVIFALIDLFNNYVFTIEESTPLEQDIALDPELLGMAFENLIGFYNPETKENARKQTGSFYTPREIVDYMCSESLKETLKTHFPDLRTHIDELIDNNEDQLNFPQKNNMIAAITNLKILDPACGSGAFPMGMFNLMVRTIEKLQERKTTYKNKLDIIQNCIYGVDIQNIAIEITKLRFFISLLVDYETPGHIEDFDVLPNLETKFVVANTLIGIEKKNMQDDIFGIEQAFKELTNVFLPFTTAKTPKEKETIKNAFFSKKETIVNDPNFKFGDNAKNQIIAWNPFNVCYCSPFFDSSMMFGVTDGFDVVIGNPPYVDYRKISKEYKTVLFDYEIAQHSKVISLYNYFFEMGINLLKRFGCLIYITPQQYLILDNCKGVRDIMRNNRILFLSDFSNVKVFKAGTYPFISCVKKEKSDIPVNYFKFDSIDSMLPIKTLKLPNPISEPVCTSEYVEIIDKIENQPLQLKDYAAYVFCASSSTLTLCSDNKKTKFITSSDIQSYSLKKINAFVDKKYYSKQSAKKQNGNVIYTSRMTKTIRACLIENNKYIGGKVNVIKVNEQINERFVLGLLNSKLINFWYLEKYSMQHLQGGYLPINTTELEKIPMPKVSIEVQQSVITLVDKILAAKAVSQKADTSALELGIDSLIYGLYNVTQEEVDVIEREFKKE